MPTLLRRPTRLAAAGLALGLALTAGLAGPASADTINLTPIKDATLYEQLDGLFASGAGPTMFAGRTNIGFEDIRRGLIQFDVAGSVPAGATINSVALNLYMSRSISGDVNLTLHPVTQAWGEGASNAGVNGGSGVGALAGDATWKHTFNPGSTWTNPGGDFAAAASATATVGLATGFYTWGSTPEMVADAQAWLDAPGSNYGWLLKGDESTTGTAKRFDTRESSTVLADTRPVLAITYSPRAVPVEATTWGGIKGLYR